MAELKENEVHCCKNGCGECDLNADGNSECCDAPVFVWDIDTGTVVNSNDS